MDGFVGLGAAPTLPLSLQSGQHSSPFLSPELEVPRNEFGVPGTGNKIPSSLKRCVDIGSQWTFPRNASPPIRRMSMTRRSFLGFVMSATAGILVPAPVFAHGFKRHRHMHYVAYNPCMSHATKHYIAASASSHVHTSGALEPAPLGWQRLGGCTYAAEFACTHVYSVSLWKNGTQFAVKIYGNGIFRDGDCGCPPFFFRTGQVRARANGTGGGFLDTGDIDVHSGGLDSWTVFDVNPGALTSCSLSASSWCTT
jgi:hypothetical protein